MLELKKVTRGKEAEMAHICLPCYACYPHPVACTPDIPCGPGFCIPDMLHCIPDDIGCSPYVVGPCSPSVIAVDPIGIAI